MVPLGSRSTCALLFCLALGACGILGARTVDGSGDPAAQSWDVADFTEVTFSVPGALFIEQGTPDGLHAEGDDNILDALEIEVRNGRLEVGTGMGVSLRPVTPLRFRLRLPELTRLSLAGTGNVEVSEFRAEALTVRLAGSGSVTTADLDASSLDLEIAGSGRFTGWGAVARQQVQVAGSGDVDVADMESDEARVEIAGSGSVRVRARDVLDARIAGSGTIRYSGDPRLSTSIAGSGTVRPTN